MTVSRLWIAAGAALVVAIGLLIVGQFGGSAGDDARALVDDGSGDVAGQAPAEVEARLDIRRAELIRAEGDLTLVVTLVEPLDRSALEAEPLTVEASLRSGNVTYEVRASIGRAVAQATVTDLASLDQPYALPEPEVDGTDVRLVVPADGVPELAETFAWGAATRLGGAQDVVPADRSALFPPLEEAGIGRARSNR